MKIEKTGNLQNFQRLNYKNVSSLDRKYFVRPNLQDLKHLGDKYNINLTSCYSDVKGYESIDIEVSKLKNLGFFKRLFEKKGRSSFQVGYTIFDEPTKAKEDFMVAVNEAIADLKAKLAKN